MTTKQKPPPVYPPPSTTSSSSVFANIVVAAAVRKASSTVVMKTSNPKTTKFVLRQKQPTTAKFAGTAAPDTVQSKTSIVKKKKKQPLSAVAKMEPSRANKRAKKLAKTLDHVEVVVKPVVSSSMTLSQLNEEMKARYPDTAANTNLLLVSGKNRLLKILGIGTELRSCSAEYKAKQQQDARKAAAAQQVQQQLIHNNNIFQSSRRCHDPSLFADSSALRAELEWGQQPVDEWQMHQKRRRSRLHNGDGVKQQRRSILGIFFSDEEDDNEFNEEQEKFPHIVRNPSNENRNADNKLQYTVWTTRVVHDRRRDEETEEWDDDTVGKKFDSSFATLEDANLRVEYLFHYEAVGGWWWHVAVDEKLAGGLRYMKSKPDRGRSMTICVLPSKVFDILQYEDNENSVGLHRHEQKQPKQPPRKEETHYPKHIRKPGAANKRQRKKLRFTVWTSCEYGNDSMPGDYYCDDWHSNDDCPTEKEFNSSYDTIEEANERAEYVFYYKYETPWGLDDDDDQEEDEDEQFPHNVLASSDFVSSKTGFRRLECHGNDGESWTVSVMPSNAFDYIDILKTYVYGA